MLRSRLYDRGAVTMLVYPVVTIINRRGNKVETISDIPVPIKVTIKEDRSSDAELPGEVSARVLRCQTREAPVSSWGRVEYDGEDWDIAIPPYRSPGMSKSTQHVEFTLRSRNKIKTGDT
jgi:hypothetical protein